MVDGTPTWRNWAGNQTARPLRVSTPRSTEDVVAAVHQAAADGRTVRMTGAGHSFTAAAVTDGVLLRPDGMCRIRSIDRSMDTAGGLVTVEAGCSMRALNDELLSHGLALANMGDIQEQT